MKRREPAAPSSGTQRAISSHSHLGSTHEDARLTSGTRVSVNRFRRPTKIVCFTSTSGFGGTEKHLIDLILKLDPIKNDVSIHCIPSIRFPAIDPYSESLIQQHRLPVKIHKHTNPFNFMRAWLIVANEKADVVLFVNGRLGLFPGKAYLAARLAGARKVIAIEQLMGPARPPKVRGSNWLINCLRDLAGGRTRHLIGLKLTGILCDMTICVSHGVRRRLINEYGYPAAKTMTVWNGVDTARFEHSESSRSAVRQELKLSLEETVLLCVARLDRVKGIDILLQALKALSEEGLRCQCKIVGDGPLEQELLQERDRLGLSDSVHFLGFRNDDKVPLPFMEEA